MLNEIIFINVRSNLNLTLFKNQIPVNLIRILQSSVLNLVIKQIPIFSVRSHGKAQFFSPRHRQELNNPKYTNGSKRLLPLFVLLASSKLLRVHTKLGMGPAFLQLQNCLCCLSVITQCTHKSSFENFCQIALVKIE